jgi:starch phosphorylase
MKFSKHINGVSKQHAEISKKIWAGIFPEKPMIEIPIEHITNGVHTSWISPPFTDLFGRYLGPDYIHYSRNKNNIWERIYNIPDEQLWEEHRRNKKDMINFIRRQFAKQIIAGAYSRARMLNVKTLLNRDYLTIVFARRFAGYKRPTLILKDKQRLFKILTNPSKPVQIIFSGKAHPADEHSKQMIKEIIDFAAEYQVQGKVIFLENYDINIARHLYWGADVWLNTPAAKMEASGTSGMKATMNGVLHASTLEGWWCEGFDGTNGWAITAGREYENPELQESADANQLYNLLENEITELYYSRDDGDVPGVWVRMMKDSIYSVCQNFSINRVLSDYLRDVYMPAKKGLTEISRDNYKPLQQAVKEEKIVLKYWDSIKFVSFTTNIEKKERMMEGEQIEIECGVAFGQAQPELFSLELFYMSDSQKAFKIIAMKLADIRNDVVGYKHTLEIQGYGPQSFNVRIKPANLILQDIHPELVKWLE